MILDESSIKRFVRQEIMRSLNVILTASTGDNSGVETETIENLYPGSPSIPKRPVMHPYGFVSRAPKKTLSVVARHGADATNRMVLGHRDSNRPTDLNEGEAIIYAADGNQIKLGEGVTASNDGGSFKLDADGNWIYEAGSTTAKFTSDGKFSVTNAMGELMTVIYALFDEVQKATVPTMMGPQNLIMPLFATEFSKLESFKE